MEGTRESRISRVTGQGRFGSWTTLAALLLLVAPPLAHALPCPADCDGSGDVTVDELVRAVNIALGTAGAGECAVADFDHSGAVTVDELVGAVNAALSGCPALAFSLATDFQTGSFATVTLDPAHRVDPVRPGRQVGSDAVARVVDGLLYIVNRFLGDNIQLIDPDAEFSTVMQCSTGPGSNPHDIAVAAPQKAYVTRYDTAQLLIVDPRPAGDCSGFQIGTIDLSSLADADGIPEMDQMAIAGDRLYVSLQRLDRNNFFGPAGAGELAVIDTTADTLVGHITLTGSNPFSTTKGLPVRNGLLLVGEAGNFGVNDGGIERVDPVTGKAMGFFITEEALGGDINDFVIVSDSLAYAVIGKSDFTSAVVSFDPSTGKRTGTLLGADFVADIELAPNGELFVADRSTETPGIRIFRAADGTSLTPAPLDIGLPPFEIVFLR